MHAGVTEVLAEREPTVCYHAGMSAEGAARFTCYARFVSIDPDRNRARFYALTWQPVLWGGGALIRAWGRLPGPGRELVAFYPDRAAAQPEVERLIARRLRRGYTLAGWQ